MNCCKYTKNIITCNKKVNYFFLSNMIYHWRPTERNVRHIFYICKFIFPETYNSIVGLFWILDTSCWLSLPHWDIAAGRRGLVTILGWSCWLSLRLYWDAAGRRVLDTGYYCWLSGLLGSGAAGAGLGFWILDTTAA